MSTAERVLNLKWDDALRLVVETDSYYFQPRRDNEGEGGSPPQANSAPSPVSLVQRVGQYFVHASTTRLCVQGTLAAYTLWVVTHASQTVPCTVTVAASTTAASHAKEVRAEGVVDSLWGVLRDVARRVILASPSVTAAPTTTHCYLYESRDGMQLLTRAPMPTFVNIAHAVSGMLLIPLTCIQKETIPHMRFRRDGTGEAVPSTPEAKQAVLTSARKARTAHTVCGIATVAAMQLMTVGGVLMRSNSVFSGDRLSEATTTTTESVAPAHRGGPARCIDFDKAIIGFAVPWVAFIPGIMASAKLRKVIPHAVIGGLITKACLAVPLARVLGGLYQRLMGVHVPLTSSTSEGGPSTLHVEQAVSGQLERGYYAGIATATVVVGLWAGVDTYKLVTAATQEVKTKPTGLSTRAVSTADGRDER